MKPSFVTFGRHLLLFNDGADFDLNVRKSFRSHLNHFTLNKFHVLILEEAGSNHGGPKGAKMLPFILLKTLYYLYRTI